jgi:hypothetical protein
MAMVALLVRWLGESGDAVASPAPSGKVPLDIVNERFRRGGLGPKRSK